MHLPFGPWWQWACLTSSFVNGFACLDGLLTIGGDSGKFLEDDVFIISYYGLLGGYYFYGYCFEEEAAAACFEFVVVGF